MRGNNSMGRRSESGMASFLIVMIMMVVITLIVLGFSQVTRRNSREALDRQLSSQAFYAAESGVNVTTNAILRQIRANGYQALNEKTSCANNYDPTATNGVGTTIDQLSSGVKYTCVLVNPNPNSLKYNITQRGSTVFPIATTASLSKINFSWNVQTGGTDTSCSGSDEKQFPRDQDWTCDYGVLRVDLVANPNGNISDLAGNTLTFFLTPLGAHSGQSSTVTSFGSPKAYIVSANCGTATCSATVNLAGGASQSSYAARVTSIYNDAPNMVVTGTLSPAGTASFSGAQAVVDTTGQAQDTLRRIQVRVQLSAAADPSTIPAYGLGSTTDVCKHFSIMPGANIDPSNLCQ